MEFNILFDSKENYILRQKNTELEKENDLLRKQIVELKRLNEDIEKKMNNNGLNEENDLIEKKMNDSGLNEGNIDEINNNGLNKGNGIIENNHATQQIDNIFERIRSLYFIMKQHNLPKRPLSHHIEGMHIPKKNPTYIVITIGLNKNEKALSDVDRDTILKKCVEDCNQFINTNIYDFDIQTEAGETNYTLQS